MKVRKELNKQKEEKTRSIEDSIAATVSDDAAVSAEATHEEKFVEDPPGEQNNSMPNSLIIEDIL